jgi:uncharacterized RDD family membrane protein YckC
MKPAAIFTRILALFIDWLILGLIVLEFLIFISSSNTLETVLNNLTITFIGLMVIPIIIQIVQAYLTAKYGGSIGKLICGLMVTDENNQKISLNMAFFRTFIGPVINSPMIGLGYFWVFRNERRQGWHDLAIGTTVVENNSSQNILGILTSIIFVVISVVMIMNIISNFQINSNLYLTTFTDIYQEINQKIKASKSKTENISSANPISTMSGILKTFSATDSANNKLK